MPLHTYLVVWNSLDTLLSAKTLAHTKVKHSSKIRITVVSVLLVVVTIFSFPNSVQQLQTTRTFFSLDKKGSWTYSLYYIPMLYVLSHFDGRTTTAALKKKWIWQLVLCSSFECDEQSRMSHLSALVYSNWRNGEIASVKQYSFVDICCECDLSQQVSFCYII